MPHIQLNLDFITHPKTLSTSPLAQLLFIRSLIYAATHLTDGMIPAAALPTISYDLTQYERLHYVPANIHAAAPDIVTVDELIAELLANKRWKICDKGYRIHDYLDYQLSKRQVLQLVDNRRKAGQAGGQARAKAHAQALASGLLEANVKQPASTLLVANAKQNQAPSHSPSHSPSHDHVKEEKKENSPAKRANGRVGKRALPEELVLTPEEREQWDRFGINSAIEFASFKDHARTENRFCADWEAAKRNWMRKAIRLKDERSQRVLHPVRG